MPRKAGRAAAGSPNVTFFIARQERDAVGCGGIALAQSAAEVKRMYVRPEARGRGVARTILARLEEARIRGISLLVLETGDAQQSAMRLYERAGFKRRAAFGEYAEMPPISHPAKRVLRKTGHARA